MGNWWDPITSAGSEVLHFLGLYNDPSANAAQQHANAYFASGQAQADQAKNQQAAAQAEAQRPQIQQSFDNFLATNPVGQVIAPVLQTGVGYSTNAGFHTGMSAPAPAAPTNQQLTSQVNNAAQTYQQNNPTPPITYSTPAQPTAPQAYSPGYKPVGQVNASTYLPDPSMVNPNPSGNAVAADAAPATTVATTPATTAPTSKSTMTDYIPAIIAGAGGIVGAVGSATAAGTEAQASKDAAAQQAAAQQAAITEQQNEFNTINNNQKPWRDAGSQALNDLQNFNFQPFTAQQFQQYQDPGYQFRLDQGINALQNSAAARGQLLSGNTMKAISDYGQNSASQEYQNAFNRYMASQGQHLNALQSLAGLGQSAVQQVGQAGQNAANNISQSLVGQGNALAQGTVGAANANASGYVGGANAVVNALNNGYNTYQSNQYLSKLAGNGGN